MRHDAARALRVDDDTPRDSAELHAVASVLTDADGERASRRFGRPSAEATMALRHFERLVEGSEALEAGSSGSQGFVREAAPDDAPAPRRAQRAPDDAPAPRRAQRAPDPEPEAPVRPPLNAPGRAYGSRPRTSGFVASQAAGYQAGRRTVEITGQAQAPRRRPPATAAMTARPDRIALYAFMLAMFLVVMALATAHP
jgi:hypothetical protein